MVWLTFLVIWKPVLGLLNDKIGLVGMMLISMTLMALAIVYLPSMVYGSSVALMYVAMVFLSAGISNALVTPPLVITQAMGLREFGKIFALAVAFIYAGTPSVLRSGACSAPRATPRSACMSRPCCSRCS